MREILEVIGDRRPSSPPPPSTSLSYDILFNMWSVPPGAGALWHLSTAHRRFRAKLITVRIRDYSLLFNTDCVDVHFTSLRRSVWPGDESLFKRNAVLKGKKKKFFFSTFDMRLKRSCARNVIWRRFTVLRCSTHVLVFTGTLEMSAYSFLRINIMKEIINQALGVCVGHQPVLIKPLQTTEVYLLQKSREGLDGRIYGGTLRIQRLDKIWWHLNDSDSSDCI